MKCFNTFLLVYPSDDGKNTDQFGYTPMEYTMAILVFCLLASLIIYLCLKDRNGNWSEGRIPKNFKATSENLYEIYIAAACALIARDPERLYMKFGKVSNHLEKHFPNEHYNFSESYSFSLKYLVKIDSLAEWCNTKLNEKQKAQLLNFLIDISATDGDFNNDERKYIFVLTQKLKLTFNHVEERLKPYFYAEEPTQEAPTKTSRSAFFEVLGLEETASIPEIKLAYRKLAKLTHPDRFSREPLEVQEQMKRKFQQIQEAYEALIAS